MTPDEFFRFAQDNKEMLLQLRETYSSRLTRRKAVRPRYDEFMVWAIQHAGVFSSEEEKTGNEEVDEDVLQAMYTGLQQRIDRMLDEVRGRKVERKYKEGYEDARRAQRSLSNNGRLPVRI
jgi:hypothetical protein